jgi:hypothetical protein
MDSFHVSVLCVLLLMCSIYESEIHPFAYNKFPWPKRKAPNASHECKVTFKEWMNYLRLYGGWNQCLPQL